MHTTRHDAGPPHLSTNSPVPALARPCGDSMMHQGPKVFGPVATCSHDGVTIIESPGFMRAPVGWQIDSGIRTLLHV